MKIIDKIKNHFETEPWHYKFTWNDGKRYGDKYESVKSLAKKIGHPYTSLYLSIHELVKKGFLDFQSGLIIYERCLSNSDQNVQESDTTEAK